MNFINGFLTIYVGILTAAHLVCLMGIARFYERKAGTRTYYQLFLIPIVLLLLASVRYAMLPEQISADPLGDILRFSGGGLTLGLIFYLFKLMMGRRA